MARDAGSDDKSNKRRWGRGKAEEGPSDDELGWLADLRGARDTRAPLAFDEPTGTVSGRGRRGGGAAEAPAPPPPSTPPPTPAKGRSRNKLPPVVSAPVVPAPVPAPEVPPPPKVGRRGKRSDRGEPAPPTSASPPPVPQMGTAAPAAPPAAGPAPPPAAGPAPPRTGLRRTPSVPPPPVPPVPPPPVLPARGPSSGTARPAAGAGRPPPPPAAPAEPKGWEDLTDEVPPLREEPPTRPGDGRPRGARTDPRRPTGPPTGSFGGPAAGGLTGAPSGPVTIVPKGPPGGPPKGEPARPSGPPPADLLVTTGTIKRAEIRRQLRVQQQLKVATLVVVALLLLLAYPMYELTRAGAQDPVLGHLDSLSLPGWADTDHKDATAGSRWCIKECRFRQRTWASERLPDETNLAFDTALRDAGWRPRTEGLCPPVEEGTATCWKRDEYVMDMWVRAPVCDLPPPRATKPPASPGASPSPGTQQQTCPGALVTMRIFNAVDYQPAP